MFHELIDPKKKTNKSTALKSSKPFHDSKPFSDLCNFEPSDSENKEAESSSTTFIPPWLRNSLGLNQRHNQSHAAAGHSDSKPPKIIPRYKEPIQNEFEGLKTNPEEDCCKKVPNQFDSLPSSCPLEENIAQNSDVGPRSNERVLPMRWQMRPKESDTDSSCAAGETKSSDKEELKVTNADVLGEMGKVKEDEEEKKKQIRFVRQRSKLRKRLTTEQRAFEANKNTECLLELKTREALDCYLKKNVHTVPSETKQLEAKLSLLNEKQHSTNTTKLNSEEVRLLQDMKEQVGSIGDFDMVLEKVKEVNMREIIKNSDFLTNNLGESKVEGMEERSGREFASRCEDLKSNADKDSLLSTDDENDIKRFSEFLSKNKNAEEKRKCLEEVRNYFEKKRKTRMSKRQYLDQIKSKLEPEYKKKEEFLKEKTKCKELFLSGTNRGRKSKFALCDEEVVEKAVNETLQKFVEMYHFHVSPTVMGNMKKNILQAMQSDSMDSSSSKINLLEFETKSLGKKTRNDGIHSPQRPQKNELRSFNPQGESLEGPNREILFPKELKKKNFKTLVASSNETLEKPLKEMDVVENERLKRLNKEFENFLHSIQNHVDVSTLKIQSVILEKEEASPSKQMQFVYNFMKKGVDNDRLGHWQALKNCNETKTFKEIGVQASIKREPLKRSVRVQAVENQITSEQSLQTEEKTFLSQPTQTEEENFTLREFKELKNVDISPGLYRMIKSKEAGKFYLYPEEREESSQVLQDSTSSVLKDRKLNNRRDLLNELSKERTKERRVYFRDKEKGKFKKYRRAFYTVAHFKGSPSRREKHSWEAEGVRGAEGGGGGLVEEAGGASATLEAGRMWRKEGKCKSGTSISCLYFRDFDSKNSESLQSKREFILKSENEEVKEQLGLGDTKEREHFGCVWFWNGEKITPGCDLKTHVEDLLKEKLREITDLEVLQNKLLVNGVDISKMDPGQLTDVRDSAKNFDPKSVLCFSTFNNNQIESQFEFAANKDSLETKFAIEEGKGERNEQIEKKEKNEKSEKNEKIENESKNDDGDKKEKEKEEEKEKESIEVAEEMKILRMSISQEKMVRNVGTQNSQQTILSLNVSTGLSQSKMAIGVPKKKYPKRNPNLKPFHKKLINFKKAEEIIKAVEEIKKLKLELENNAKNSLQDTESALEMSSTTSTSKNDSDDRLPKVLSFRESPKPEDMGRFKNVVGYVDEVQKTDLDLEGRDSEASQDPSSAPNRHKHLELIENVLCRVSQKERESLWNDVRDFIKTKIGRDINDDGAREVCIEIEQDIPKNDNGTMNQAVMARGHYVRNEGDVEVEIDLTLDDLERILRQRQRKIRKQHIYRKKYRRFISSSSFQSDLTRDDVRKYEKYLNKFAVLGGGFLTERSSNSFKKSKGN